MKLSHYLLFGSFMCSQLSLADGLEDKLQDDMKLIKVFSVQGHDSGRIKIRSKDDLWVGLNFEFPQDKVEAHKDNYVFEIRDTNGNASLSTGPVDNSAATIFKPKKGSIVVSYKNNTNLSYSVIIWVRNIRKYNAKSS